MKNSFDARMGMLLAVSEYCNKNNTVINSVTALKNKITEFNQRLNDLRSAAQNLAQPTRGITNSKAQARDKAIEMAFKVSCALYAYAESEKNEVLKGQVDFTFKKLDRMRDTQFMDVLENLLALATQHAGSLGDLGITAAVISQFGDDVAAYKELLGKPKAARAERSMHRASVQRQLTDMNTFLKEELDKLMMTLQDSEPDFISGYRSARSIDNSHTFTTRTGGTVTKADQTPAEGAKVELIEAGTDAVKYSTTTDSDGTFSIKGLKSGVYDVKVSYNGNPEPTVLKGISIQRRKANKVEVTV